MNRKDVLEHLEQIELAINEQKVWATRVENKLLLLRDFLRLADDRYDALVSETVNITLDPKPTKNKKNKKRKK